MLGMKKVDAIMVNSEIEDIMNHFSHTTSDREVMPEHYFKSLYEKKLKAISETIEASQDMSALLKGIEADLKQREKDLKKLPKKSIYDENYKSQDVTKQGRNLSAKVKQYLKGKNTILTKVKVADLDMKTPGFGRIIGDLGDVNFADTTDPIVVDVDGKTILDGFHRVQKAKDIGKEEIPAYIVDENLADGKVKGKSRPGRVKRAGASCKGSATELRKKAKKYSGERGKMYHWCANMKAGKKKS